MDPKLRIGTRLPLTELWRDDGFTTQSRGRFLTKDDITNLLRAGSMQFVVADVGLPLRWIQIHECYKFWKQEVKSHLASPNLRLALDQFPDGYCYFASQWAARSGEVAIVVLEKSH